MDLRDKAQGAKSTLGDLLRDNPDFPLWKSVDAQLDFVLSDFEADGSFRNSATRERVSELLLGVLAVREIESLDPDLADLLCQIDYEYKNLYRP